MGKIWWLASYLKSGNTWLRVFLENLRKDDSLPASINALNSSFASRRKLIDQFLGLESSDLTAAEINRYRPHVYSLMALQSKQDLFVKIHDAFWASDALPIIPPDDSAGVLYLLRNPLDVAASLAHHNAQPYDDTIGEMADDQNWLEYSAKRITSNAPQKLLSWSKHVLSWVDQTLVPLHILRYEDMATRPVETFSTAVQFMGLPFDEDRIRQALALSDFATLQAQEQQHGFREKSSLTKNFFRKGKVGSWREELTDQQRDRIIADHGALMRRFGYLADDSNPVF